MIFNRLFESRNAFTNVWASGESLDFGNASNVTIDQDNVFQINAVFSAVNLISSTVSTLPLEAFVRQSQVRFPMQNVPAWVRKPDVDLPASSFWQSVIVSMLIDGNAFVRVFSNNRGVPVNLVVLNPTTVNVKRGPDGRIIFIVKGEDAPLTSDQLIHIPDLLQPGEIRGISRTKVLSENFGLALALEKFAATFFGSGTNLAGVIEFPGNLSQEQSDALRNGFDKAHSGWKRGHKTGVLTGGASWKSTQIDPDKSTLVESRNQAVSDIARIFSIPPHLLALPGTNSYASVEQTNLAWVTHGLRPILSRLEQSFTPLLQRSAPNQDVFLKFNLDGLLRADINSRMTAYSVAMQSGFMTVNDIRTLEDLPPIDDVSADTVRVSLANVNIDAANLVAEDKKVTMAQKLINSGFKPEQVMAALDLPAIEHSGVAPVMLQGVAQIDPADPSSVYEVK